MNKLASCLDLLQELVAIPSESQNEEAMARFLYRYLQDELNMDCTLQHVDGKSYNVIGRLGRGDHKRRLLLGGHIDTVSPSPRWETDPYVLCRRGDELHALGAGDMKGGLAAQLIVLSELKRANALPDADICFVGLADEERHSIGAHAFVELERQRPAQESFFIMAEPHYDNIVIGATGKALLSLHVKGQENHAATPEKGINAIDCMAQLLCAVGKKYDEAYRQGECASWCVLKIENPYPGYSLTIPGECSCLVNKQLHPSESIEEFIGSLHRLYEESVGRGLLEVRREIPSYPAYRLDAQHPDVAALKDYLRTRWKREPELRVNQSVSDGNVLYNSLGIPTVLFGPKGVHFHTEGEYLSVSSLESYMEELEGYLRFRYGSGK